MKNFLRDIWLRRSAPAGAAHVVALDLAKVRAAKRNALAAERTENLALLSAVAAVIGSDLKPEVKRDQLGLIGFGEADFGRLAQWLSADGRSTEGGTAAYLAMLSLLHLEPSALQGGQSLLPNFPSVELFEEVARLERSTGIHDAWSVAADALAKPILEQIANNVATHTLIEQREFLLNGKLRMDVALGDAAMPDPEARYQVARLVAERLLRELAVRKIGGAFRFNVYEEPDSRTPKPPEWSFESRLRWNEAGRPERLRVQLPRTYGAGREPIVLEVKPDGSIKSKVGATYRLDPSRWTL